MPGCTQGAENSAACAASPAHTLSPYLCFVISHMPVHVPALVLSTRCFVLYLLQYFYPYPPPTLQVIPLPAWDSWLYWWRGSAMSQHVMFLLLGYFKPWALWCSLSRAVLFVICFSCCWGDTTQTVYPIDETFIFMAASCYFRVKAFYGRKATLEHVTFC